jgi:hypothetical protein
MAALRLVLLPLVLLHGLIRQGPAHPAVRKPTGSTESLGPGIADLTEFYTLLAQEKAR